MFSKSYLLKFIKRYSKLFSKLDEVVLVKCENLSPKLEKTLKSSLGDMGVIVKDLWYAENGLGQMGVPLAMKEFSHKSGKDYYAIVIRGRKDKPTLYKVKCGLATRL